MEKEHLDVEGGTGPLFIADRLPVLVDRKTTFTHVWPFLRLCPSHEVGISRFSFGVAGSSEEEPGVPVNVGVEWLEDIRVFALPADPQACWTLRLDDEDR